MSTPQSAPSRMSLGWAEGKRRATNCCCSTFIVKIRSASRIIQLARLRARWALMSMPTCHISSIAKGSATAPSSACRPAEKISCDGRHSRISPSAMGLRQILPVQSKRILRVTSAPRCGGNDGRWQGAGDQCADGTVPVGQRGGRDVHHIFGMKLEAFGHGQRTRCIGVELVDH